MGTVLLVVNRNSGSKVTRSAAGEVFCRQRLRLHGVNPALHAGSVILSLGGFLHAVPCVTMVPLSSVYSTMLEIQKPGRIRFRQGALPLAFNRRRPSSVVVSLFVDPGQRQGEFPVLDDMGEPRKSVSPHGLRLEYRFRLGSHHVLGDVSVCPCKEGVQGSGFVKGLQGESPAVVDLCNDGASKSLSNCFRRASGTSYTS